MNDRITLSERDGYLAAALSRQIMELSKENYLLRASNAELLAAARTALDNMNDGRPDFHPYVRPILQAAITKAEALS